MRTIESKNHILWHDQDHCNQKRVKQKLNYADEIIEI